MKRSKELIDLTTTMIRRCEGFLTDATHVFEDILCVTGNGYKWKDGVPTYITHEDDEIEFSRYISAEDAIKKMKDDHIAFLKRFFRDDPERLEEIISDFNKNGCRRLDKRIETIKNSERLAKEPFYYFEVYPLNERAIICNIPDDVREDYKWVIKEFYENVLVYCKEKSTVSFLPVIKEKIDSWNLSE